MERPGSASSEFHSSKVIRGSKFIGKTVRNRAGEDLGDIKDVVIDLDDDRVAYAVLASGGFLGLGEKYFAIPPESLEVSADQDYIVVDLSKDQLKNAPGFDKDNWPDMADRAWGSTVYNFYGREPYWKRKSESEMRREI